MYILQAGLPDFLGPKTGKIYQMTTNYTKRLLFIPYDQKIFQMVIKYNNIFHSKALQILPKLVFFVSKYTIWQPWLEGSFSQQVSNPGRKFYTCVVICIPGNEISDPWVQTVLCKVLQFEHEHKQQFLSITSISNKYTIKQTDSQYLHIKFIVTTVLLWFPPKPYTRRDSNPGLLIPEAVAISTAPQPMP
jgi:hypothetical protein